MATLTKQNRYTFADYLTREEDERIEIIHGEIFLMSSPSSTHQEISMELSRQLANFLEGKPCRVYPAPFDVRLFEQNGDTPEHIDTVVIPDISVICSKNKIDEKGCKGAPDMIIEILSPSSLRNDRLIKLRLYQQAGVSEYWIADPKNKTVQVFLLDNNGILRPHEDYGRTDPAKVNILEGCFIELEKVFLEQ